MGTLTIRVPDATHERLKQLAKAKSVSVNKLIEELSAAALAEFDADPWAPGADTRIDHTRILDPRPFCAGRSESGVLASYLLLGIRERPAVPFHSNESRVAAEQASGRALRH